MNTLVQDLRHALRMMANAPGFAAIAILTLALGIGGNATVFSWIRSILLNPIPAVRDSEQMVAVESIMPSGEYHTSSYPDYKDFRAQNHVFSDVIGFELSGVNMSLRNTEPAERVWGIIATENYFDVLGVRAAMGEHVSRAGEPGAEFRSVYRAELWVVGAEVRVRSECGRQDRSFERASVHDYWSGAARVFRDDCGDRRAVFCADDDAAAGAAGRKHRGAQSYFRAHHGAAEAGSEHRARAGGSGDDRGESGEGIFDDEPERGGVCRAGVEGALRSAGFSAQRAGIFDGDRVAGAADCVRERGESAAGACHGARTGNCDSRGDGSEPEPADPADAGRERGASVGGGIGGILLALWGANLLSFFTPATKHLPIGLTLGVDKTVLAFTLILSIATGIIFGLVPAWRGSRTNLNESLKSAGRVTEGRAGSHRLRDALVIAEVVFATVLLVCAGLLLRSMRNAEAAGPGFNTNHVALAAFDLRTSGYSSEEATLYYDRLLEKIRTLPGVESASLERFVPLWFTGRSYSPVEAEAYTPAPGEDMNIDLNMVGADYLHTLQIPLISGRDFTEQDRADSPKVVIVNQTLAKRFWPGQDATGHRLRVWGDWRTVVGVARDIKYHRMNEPPQSFLYVPSLQARGTDANIIVRSELPTAAVVNAVRASAISLDAKVQPLEADDLGGLLHVSMFANRTAASLASVLGGLGLLLAALGIYGVLSYSVSQRFREIGIRVALGAQKGHVLRLVVGKGLQLAILGAAAGAAVALLVTRAMRDLLFGVGAGDPLTFAIVALGVTFVAAIAAYLPARRAMRVDPMVALRYE